MKCTVACLVILACALQGTAEDIPEAKRLQPLTRGQTLFIPDMDHDFHRHIKVALIKHKVRLRVVNSIEQADLVFSAQVEVKPLKPDPVNTLGGRIPRGSVLFAQDEIEVHAKAVIHAKFTGRGRTKWIHSDSAEGGFSFRFGGEPDQKTKEKPYRDVAEKLAKHLKRRVRKP